LHTLIPPFTKLYERGIPQQDILNLFRFIDWAIQLPNDLKQQFWQELRDFEEQQHMPYITSVEQIGFERGLQEGRQEGQYALILRLLTRRVGEIPADLAAQIEALPLARLEALGEALLDFTGLSDLQAWLNR
jgi:flagellar biosynthesis/type III secretory pathway protein FliH